MKYHLRQGQPLRKSVSSGHPRRRPHTQQDKIFHLRTTIALNDPFLRGVYGAVWNFLDDHPYPSTRDEYQRRTREINRNVRDLNLSTMQMNFLQRLMMETGITVVRLLPLADRDASFFVSLPSSSYVQGGPLARFSCNCTR